MIFTLNPVRQNLAIYPGISALIGGVIAALTQPPTFYPWALVGFTILLYLIYSAPTLKSALYRNSLFSFGFFGYGFYWSTIAISVYIDQFWWAIPIAFFGLPSIFIFFTSLITIPAWKYRHNKHYVLIYTILWIFMEWLTSWIFTGLPWMLVGYTAGFSDIIAQFASIGGIFGLSLVLFNVAGTFYYVLGHEKRIQKADILYSLIVLVLISAYGIWRMNTYPVSLSDIRVRIVQPSIPQGDKWEEEKFWDHLKEHKFISRLKTKHKPDIILWSEAAIMAPYQVKIVRDFLNIVVQENEATLITGAISKKNSKFYTSLIALSPESKLLFEYNKKHLVPFGEYVPFKDILLFKKLTHGLEDYAMGDGEDIFQLDSLRIRPLICYESIFPEEVRTNDADLFVNITNSSWYGNSTAPYHLFYVNKFRAIENSTPVIISANSGISGAFDSLGREIAKTSLNDLVAVDLSLPRKIQAFSPYSLLGLIVILPIVTLLQILRFLTYKSPE